MVGLDRKNFWLSNCNFFAVGFAIISSFIVTIRQLSPIVGESIIITSCTVAAFLSSIYYGYNLKDNKPFFLSLAMLIGICLSDLFIRSFNLIIQHIFPGNNVYITLFLFLLLIVFPIGYLFGRSKMFNAPVSMVGIICGSIITPIVLMRFLGIATTVVIISSLFVVISMLKDLNHHIFSMNKIIVYLLVVATCYYVNVIVENNDFVATNAYANYKVINRLDQKILSINNSYSSAIQQHSQQGFAYIELIKKLLFFDLKLINKNILIMGAGGFSFTANGNWHNKITYIDLDPDLKSIVTKHFNKDINANFIAADAAVFINNAKYDPKQKYAAIVSDVYSSKHIIPSHLLTIKYFRDINMALEDQGVAIFNIIAKPSLNDIYSMGVDHNIRTVFSRCMVIPINYFVEQVSNIIYVCQKS